jgi:hypothetical protein
MQCGEVSHAKPARPLSQNEIREIVMDLDSDEGEYCASDMEEEAMPTFATVFLFKAPFNPRFSLQQL